jgi:hypothetical protein
LPSTPVDGMQIAFQTVAMAADGVVWHLRYNAGSSSTYKWEFIGGGEILGVGSGANQTLTATAVNTNCSVAIPLAGVYEARGVCQFAGGTGDYVLNLNGAGLSLAPFGYFAATGGGGNMYLQASERATLSVGTLSLAVASAGATPGFATAFRRLWAKPVRVG